MENQARSNKPLHPLAWAAGIGVVLFTAVGVGAMMGWIPSSMGRQSDTVALETPVAAKTVAPVTSQPSPARQQVAAAAPVVRAPAAVPAPAPAPVPARVAAICAECGVIESVREVTQKGSGSGIGAVGGAVVGGLLGNQVGGGRGQDVMTVVGAVGGAVAGNEVEKRVKSTKSYSITVRLNDGSSRVIGEANLPSWRTGDKVKVVNGAIQSNS